MEYTVSDTYNEQQEFDDYEFLSDVTEAYEFNERELTADDILANIPKFIQSSSDNKKYNFVLLTTQVEKNNKNIWYACYLNQENNEFNAVFSTFNEDYLTVLENIYNTVTTTEF